MYRPVIGLVGSFAVAMLMTPGIVAQPVAILPATGSSATTSSSTTTTPTPSTSPVDLTHMNWRFGQMSPYAQQPITGSATTQATVPAPSPTANTNNPFVGSTLATQGSLISNGTTSTTPAVQPASSGSTSSLSSSIYVSRFVTFDNLVPNYGVTPPLTQPPTDPFLNTSTLAGISSGSTAIPEPTTLLMCGGLLALVGYGYSRRRLKTEVKVEEKSGGEADDVKEAVGV